VEGFFGSAVQLALLEQWRVKPPQVRCVLVHALNPWGFAWLRRTDERNVDLNRNFLQDGEPFAGAPQGYVDLDPVLNPTRSGGRWLLPALLPALVRRGAGAVRRAIAVGQYEYPRGLFYGGDGPSMTRRILEAALPEWLGPCEQIVHLDLHTGLGPRATGQLLIDYGLGEGERARVTRWFGTHAIRVPESDDLAYTARGGFGRWCVAQALAPRYLFAFAEFGTCTGLRVLGGLRAENRASHWSLPGDPDIVRARTDLKELFCPSDPLWRARTLAAALAMIAQAEQGLAAG
jgi:hypothetical protein